jgi:KDO2-lipid IV(A) lauroyltransferase
MAYQTTLAPETNGTPLRKRIERSAGRMLIRLCVGPIRTLPLPMARGVGAGLAWVAFRALGRYRRVARKNLALIYPEKPAAEREQMARAVFRHFGRMVGEFLKLPRLSAAEVDRLVVVEGEENLRQALAMGRGVLLITGHFGNWEFMARWLSSHGYPINVVARDARDPTATKLLTDTREGNGAKVLYRGNSARAVLQCLKKNEIIALLPDQNAADVFVPFMGQRTGTVDGPGIIHLKMGAPLLFSWCMRLPDNRFQITFEPPEVVRSSGDKSADVERTMTLINARLETQIRRNPTQWLWLHDRWKASPGVFPDSDFHADDLRASSVRAREELRRRQGAPKPEETETQP